VLLYLSLRGVSWSEFLAALGTIQPGYLVLGVLVSITSIFARAVRWSTLVRAEKPVAPLTAFWATGVGYLGNNVLPARIGDLLRSFLLARYLQISAVFVLATTVTERVLDVLALLITAAIMLLTIPGLPNWLLAAMRLMSLLGLAGLIVLLCLPVFEPFFQRLLASLPLPARFQPTAARFLGQFARGAKAFTHPGRAAVFTALTVFIWLLDGFGTTLAVRAFHLTLSLPQALLLLAALGLSSAAPSTPGYIGIYQFVAVTILPVFGFTRSQALAYITVAQVISLLVTVILGLIGLWRLGGGSPKQVLAQAESLASQADS
jgi:hypothetical protein